MNKSEIKEKIEYNLEQVAVLNVEMALLQARALLKDTEHKNSSGTREVIMVAQMLLNEIDRLKKVY
jgi:hypothetical protein